MKKAIYFILFVGLSLSSCKSKDPYGKLKKPYLDIVHVSGTLDDVEQMTTANTVNVYGAKAKVIRKTKCKVKWKNCFLHKKKYNKTVKDSLMTLHIQYRKKVLTSPYIVVKTKTGEKVAVFINEIQLDRIKQFQNTNKDKPLQLMFQGEKIANDQLKANEITSIYFEK